MLSQVKHNRTKMITLNKVTGQPQNGSRILIVLSPQKNISDRNPHNVMLKNKKIRN